MKFKTWLFTGLMAVSSFATAQEVDVAVSENYEEGVHYFRMTTPVPTIVSKGKIEVTEIFRFACGGCYYFEKTVAKWKADGLPAQTEFVQSPVVWDDRTKERAKVLVIGKALKLEAETKAAIFKAIHEAPNQKVANAALMDDDSVIALFVGLGVKAEKVKKLLKNSTIKHRVNQMDERARAFAVNGTPEIFVDGRFRISSKPAGGFEDMLKIADHLVEKIAAEKGLK
ncbi:MAG: thiol:disulfide interchange protein DsbA [Flavobacteriales bacterium]|jgi:thiol:disulfide interchange protein DsbA